ncbi:hypothetical protein CPB83DRAFT_891274 [Crepidotus variabilis]|uniref:Uncharacterized protein n=1 Tax=Crepidotus variabilis TaxID=179855 RepID=A0A9P6EMQ2_9AGAR|nr:hypothetical protein CPB83DRAFT_891274 [Crepidotus variabilis]
MVSLAELQASNAQISSSLPAGMVAVFHTRQPRVYLSGRTQESGDRITAECKALNPEGDFVFIKADLSLLRNVDDLCRDIKSKEESINLLFLSIGSMVLHTETSENLHSFSALPYYARLRFIANLLPIVQKATGLRRVVSVAGGTKEGAVDATDFPARTVSLLALRPHLASIITLSLEAMAKSAPDVSFIHEFPGPVKSNLGKDASGFLPFAMRAFFAVVGPFVFIPEEELGHRHLHILTSAKYPGSTGEEATAGVPLPDGNSVARGTNGVNGSGVYSIDWDGESANPKVELVLANHREAGMTTKLMAHTEEEFKRITGVEKI